jgi:cytochrome c oxidase cbb3-type subunit 2
MNRMPILFIGIFFTFAFAFGGLVVAPYFQVGRLQPVTDEETGNVYPPPLSGLAQEGRRVYAANGCVYCHSQQVRGEEAGSDIARGWGARRTVARDYIHEKPVMLGTMRTGPDLANVGVRLNDVDWHYRHLYNPQSIYPNSVMPPFKWLFEKRKIQGQPSAERLRFTGEFAPPEGYEIVPTQEARALVAYLLSLNRSYPLPEAPTE